MCTSEAGSKLPSTRGKRERAITSLSDLKEMEICIDGIIFDLTNFDHPGGDSVKMFCGNDCTVFYKMIHPYHPLGLRLQKLKRVGKVKGYASEYVQLVPSLPSFLGTMPHSQSIFVSNIIQLHLR